MSTTTDPDVTDDGTGEDPPPPAPASAASVEELRIELAHLRRRAETNSLQIDDLQIAASRRTRAWWREPATIISVLALIASLGATAASVGIADASRATEARNRLTGILQQINDIARTNQTLVAEFGDRAPITAAQGSARGLAGEALRIVAEQGIEMAPSDIVVIADALAFAGDHVKAVDLARDAVGSSTNPVDRISALRILATSTFAVGDVAGGRAAFSEVMDLLRGDPIPGFTPLTLDTSISQMEMQWAASEFATGGCAATLQHLQRARAAIAAYEPSQVQAIVDQLDRFDLQADACR